MKKICCLEILKAALFRRAKNPRRRTLARSILEAVKKRGGETDKAILPREKTLDQTAYMARTIKIDMPKTIQGPLD